LEQAGQNGLLKIVTDFEGMTAGPNGGPELGQLDAEVAERGKAFFVGNVAGPDPLDT
jgi:hypothetical protein